MLLQIITLSASANKLSKLKERADEYTALIMEELDPNNLGYIEVCPIFVHRDDNCGTVHCTNSINKQLTD
jgi:hypothetical protein